MFCPQLGTSDYLRKAGKNGPSQDAHGLTIITNVSPICICLHLTQFLVEAGYSVEVEQLVEYVRGLGKQLTYPDESTSNKHEEYATTVLQTVEDLLAVTSDQELPKVN